MRVYNLHFLCKACNNTLSNRAIFLLHVTILGKINCVELSVHVCEVHFRTIATFFFLFYLLCRSIFSLQAQELIMQCHTKAEAQYLHIEGQLIVTWSKVLHRLRN